MSELLEVVVVAPQSAPDGVEAARVWSRRLGETDVVVCDSPGSRRPGPGCCVTRWPPGSWAARPAAASTTTTDRRQRGRTTLSEQTVTRTDADGVATITLHTPGLSHASRAALTEAVASVAGDPTVRAVLLTGSGRAFCVGQDLAEHVQALQGDASTSLNVVSDSYNPLVLALSALRVPVVVGINGACVGAGLGLALAGDLRVAAAGAKLGTAFAGIGLSSDSALASRLVHCVGGSRAAQLLLLPDTFTAETAEQWGLVHRVVPADQVLAEATALATTLAHGPTAAYAAIKTVLATAATDSLEDTLALEARLQQPLGATRDHREAVEAFLAKRAPEFTGS